MSGADLDYAARVAQDVAARYGVTVAPAVVQVVPAGTSGMPQAVWVPNAHGGGQLVYAAPLAWNGSAKVAAQKRRRRGSAVSPDLIARRDRVREAHAAGLHDMAIAAELSLPVATVQADRRLMGLAAHAAPPVPSRASIHRRERRDQVAALHAAGQSDAAMAAQLKVCARTVAELRRELRLPPNRSRDRAITAAACAPGLSPRAQARQARAAAVHRMEAEGRSVREIAETLGLSAGYASKLRRGLGLPVRPTAAARAVQSADERRSAVLAMLADGLTDLQEIAGRAGCSYDTLRRDLKRMGRWPVLPGPMTPAERQERIRGWVAEGVPRRDIAVRLNVPLALVARDLRALGLDAPRARPSGAKPGPAVGIGDRRRSVARLRARGLTIAQIAAQLGVSRSQVSIDIRALRDSGVNMDPPPRDTPDTPDTPDRAAAVAARRQMVAALRAEGLTVAQIAARAGVGRSAVCNDIEALRAAGVIGSRPPARSQRRAADPKWAGEIRALAGKGLGVPAIAARLRFSPGAVAAVLRAQAADSDNCSGVAA